LESLTMENFLHFSFLSRFNPFGNRVGLSNRGEDLRLKVFFHYRTKNPNRKKEK